MTHVSECLRYSTGQEKLSDFTSDDTQHQIWLLHHVGQLPVMFHIQKRRENPVITVISSDTGMLPFVAANNTAHTIVFETAPVVRECGVATHVVER